MKKFITVIPLQRPTLLKKMHYHEKGNSKLEMPEDKETGFPIIPVITGYTDINEDIRIFAIVENGYNARCNLELFKEEIANLIKDGRITCSRGVECIEIEANQEVGTQVENFQKIIEVMDEDDEIHACITYGTKAQTLALKLAIQYGYRIKRNASISCIVYGQIDWNEKTPKAYIYDETALMQLDEIVRLLAETKVEHPEEAIKSILSL